MDRIAHAFCGGSRGGKIKRWTKGRVGGNAEKYVQRLNVEHELHITGGCKLDFHLFLFSPLSEWMSRQRQVIYRAGVSQGVRGGGEAANDDRR